MRTASEIMQHVGNRTSDEIAQLRAENERLTTELDAMTEERDEARIWPEWAERIHKVLIRYGYHETEDGVDLPQDLADWLEGFAAQPAPVGELFTVTYTNHRGETAQRTITPKRIYFGSTEWHPEPQWLLTAFDNDKGEHRDFALAGFGPQPGREPIERMAVEAYEMPRDEPAPVGEPVGWTSDHQIFELRHLKSAVMIDEPTKGFCVPLYLASPTPATIITDEMVEAGARAIVEEVHSLKWNFCSDQAQRWYLQQSRVALTAALASVQVPDTQRPKPSQRS